MSDPSTSIRGCAKRLLADEAANRSVSETDAFEAVCIPEKLRISLIRFIGADGFTALLRRSVALARADVSSLQDVRVTADGRLEVISEFPTESRNKAALSITEHLLELLVDFIGEFLTIRLMRDQLPNES